MQMLASTPHWGQSYQVTPTGGGGGRGQGGLRSFHSGCSSDADVSSPALLGRGSLALSEQLSNLEGDEGNTGVTGTGPEPSPPAAGGESGGGAAGGQSQERARPIGQEAAPPAGGFLAFLANRQREREERHAVGRLRDGPPNRP
jgi:hypothetical protein